MIGQRNSHLMQVIEWFAMITPGVILNKNGSLQQTFTYRGPNLDSVTSAELDTTVVKINNVLKRLPGGWALYADAHRVTSKDYPKSVFPDVISGMIDAERQDHFQKGHHFESLYYLTLIWMPPSDRESKIKDIFVKRDMQRKMDSYTEHVKVFQIETERIVRLLKESLYEVRALNSDETLTYLHSCISPKRHLVKTPDPAWHLDYHLVDTPVVPGLEPRLGKHHLRTICIRGFPDLSEPGIFDNLNRLNFEYRWTTRFIPFDKLEALGIIKENTRKWFNNRQSVWDILKSVITTENSSLQNNDAVNKSLDSDAAAQQCASDSVSFGYYTMTITVIDENEKRVDKKVRAIEETINTLGFTTITEDINAFDAWLGSLPGLCHSNIRRPILSSMNLVHMFPLSAIWAGPENNPTWQGPPLIHTQTSGNTPFRFDLHTNGDVGHTLVMGPTGMGKSLLLATMVAQSRRYIDSQVFVFDKGGSIRTLTAGLGGDFFDLGKEEKDALSFQPLAHLDKNNEMEWALDWVLQLLENEKVEITPHVKNTMWSALESVKNSPPELRRMLTLYTYTQDSKLKEALLNYTEGHPYGKLFDAAHDNLVYSPIQVFEMETLMVTKSVVEPTLQYLFHRLESYFDGKHPTLLVLDEGWTYLISTTFQAKIKQWLLELRKKKVDVIFATQSLSHIQNSPIAPDIIESCQTKIYLPNPKAHEPSIKPLYQSFGLNDREIEIIAHATGKKQYYFKSEQGSRLFELAMDQCPLAMAYCGASSKEDQNMVQEILETRGKDAFNEHWLRYKNLTNQLNVYKEIKALVQFKAS